LGYYYWLLTEYGAGGYSFYNEGATHIISSPLKREGEGDYKVFGRFAEANKEGGIIFERLYKGRGEYMNISNG
jgi:hypothetical protein